jgi:hypothetical protein
MKKPLVMSLQRWDTNQRLFAMSTAIYADIISRIDPTINPYGVQGSIRLANLRMSSMWEFQFEEEIELAKQLHAQDPEFLRSAASSFGMADEFDSWEKANND